MPEIIINNIMNEINDKRLFPLHELNWYSSNSFAKKRQKISVRRPGVEPGSIAWKATMLTVTPPTPSCSTEYMNKIDWFLDHDLHGTAHTACIFVVGVEVLCFSVDSNSVCKEIFLHQNLQQGSRVDKTSTETQTRQKRGGSYTSRMTNVNPRTRHRKRCC